MDGNCGRIDERFERMRERFVRRVVSRERTC